MEPSGGAPPVLPTSVKVVVAGGFGVGKTTFIGSISEIDPVTTEALMTDAGAHLDDVTGVEGKTTTTVALDFGRITLDESTVLYLFGTPGQDRFAFLWDDVVRGALGAIVLVDTRRIDECFPAISYFERRRTPFVVAVNPFDGVLGHELDEVREALDIAPHVPMALCDARDRGAVRDALVELLQHLLRLYDVSGTQAEEQFRRAGGPGAGALDPVGQRLGVADQPVEVQSRRW